VFFLTSKISVSHDNKNLNIQERLSGGEFILKQGKIICICNRKGGTGKTTIAVILAQMAIEADLNVAIYDMDPQQDFFDFMKYHECRVLASIDDVIEQDLTE
jgi:tetraacyldisaccharide-1-P 4'-kinase